MLADKFYEYFWVYKYNNILIFYKVSTLIIDNSLKVFLY